MSHAENWDDYRYLIVVAEAGSFAAAARALGVAQPTVRRRVEQLEAHLGVTLFERLPDGQKLSADAAALIRLAETMRETAIDLKRLSMGLQNGVAGTVRMAVTRGLAEDWLPTHLKVLHARYSNICVELLVSYEEADLRLLEADIAIRFGQPADENLVGRRLGSATCGIYGSHDYFTRHGTPTTAGELVGHRIVGTSGRIAGFAQNVRLAELVGADTETCTTDDVHVQIALARQGLGLVSVPRYMAPTDPTMVELVLPGIDVELDLWLLTHRDVRTARRVRVVIDHLYDAFKADAPRFNSAPFCNS